MNPQSGAALILEHLGGEKFLASLRARDLVIDDTHFSFTLVHDNPKRVHSVTISIEPRGGFKVACYGRIVPVNRDGKRDYPGKSCSCPRKAHRYR